MSTIFRTFELRKALLGEPFLQTFTSLKFSEVKFSAVLHQIQVKCLKGGE